jgi:hypothetical protein
MKTKSLKTRIFSVAFIFAMALSFSARAQLIAYDDAVAYYTTANWTNNANQGFGFTPWVFLVGGPNNHGHYIGNGFTMGQNTNVMGTNYTNCAFGLYANGNTGTNQSIACRGFNSPLGTNTFKIQWAAKGAGNNQIVTNGVTNTVHGWCGFTLRMGNATNNSGDFATGVRLYFYFLDGNSPSTLYVWDGNSVQSLTGTSFSNLGRQLGTNAVEVEITPASDSLHYHMVVKDIVLNKTLFTLDSKFFGNEGDTVDSVALFCQSTSGGGTGGNGINGDQNYNRLQIAVPTLVPPSFSNVQPPDGTIYANAPGTNLTFEVDSFNSTVASNFVSVFLNGVVQGSMSFNTTNATNALLGTCNAPLSNDTFYTYKITAQDANGNIATNITTFNTFLPTDLYIDASDYNYSNGLYIDSSTPSNAYANLLGTQGVDYFILDTSGTNNLAGYRPGDLPETLTLPTDATGDPIDHANERLNGHTVYNIGFTDTGNWENFTRTIPVSSNYSIYARVASTTGGQFEVEMLANSNATTSTQPLAALGRVNFLNSGGSKVYAGQLTPVVDIFGNTAVVPLSGVKTFRETSLASRIYNLEYLLVVAVTNSGTLRPYVSVASPAPNATGVLLDAPVSFTLVNRTTTVTNVQVLVDGTNVTANISTSSNAAGTQVAYQPSLYLPAGVTNTITVIVTDSGSVNTTNSWNFVTANVVNTVIPPAYALPLGTGVTNGFGLTMFKIADSAPPVLTLSNAWRELAGQIIDTNSGTPYLNLATNPVTGTNFYLETNTITYDTTGAATGTFTFTNRSPFPYVPAGAVNNNIVMQALMYMQLNAGSYHLVVRSDDGFQFTAGPTPANTNTLLGFFDLGRANTTPSDVYFTIQTNGLYPMSLFYAQEGGGGNIEFYSLTNGTPILVNDPTNPNSIKVFEALASAANPVTILNPARSGGVTSFSFLTQSGHTHYVEYKTFFTDPSWTALQTVPGNGSVTNISDSTASGAQRFYRVRTQ